MYVYGGYGAFSIEAQHKNGRAWDWGLEKKSDFGDMVAGWIPVEKMSVCDPQGDGRAHGLYHVGKFN